jgi:hypothetical protein
LSADIVARLRDFASTICSVRGDTNLDNKAVLARAAADEIERLRAELLGNAEELARLRERVTMLVEAAVEDAERAARLERVITNKEPLL